MQGHRRLLQFFMGGPILPPGLIADTQASMGPPEGTAEVADDPVPPFQSDGWEEGRQ